jgi:hypothetical protein
MLFAGRAVRTFLYVNEIGGNCQGGERKKAGMALPVVE